MEKEPTAKFTTGSEKLEDVVNSLYNYAIGRNEALKAIPESEIRFFIGELVREVDLLEKVAERDKQQFDLPEEIARKIGAIWVFAGAGTYFEPRKEDPYKTYPWAEWMDRRRLNHATRLTRKITETVSGQNFKMPLSKIEDAKKTIKKAILEHGPYIIYNGTHIENSAVAQALSQEGVIIPSEKVKIIEAEIKKTVDQIKTFELPDNFNLEEKEVAIVACAPQMLRITRMINKYKPFSESIKIRLFPVPTPREGKEEYAKMEVSGSLYYTYITADATKEPYPYELSHPYQE